jgi:phosphoribosylformylglycinamidine synthase subunit PurS
MKFIAEINVMPLKEILDPQGKAVQLGLANLGVEAVVDARVGKHITLHLEAKSETVAKKQVETACQKLLCNAIMENYTYELKKA